MRINARTISASFVSGGMADGANRTCLSSLVVHPAAALGGSPRTVRS